MTETEIVIVGLGPTGATLANILGGYGINVVVLEREDQFTAAARVHFDDEAMRVIPCIARRPDRRQGQGELRHALSTEPGPVA